jgi:hypothetical protein
VKTIKLPSSSLRIEYIKRAIHTDPFSEPEMFRNCIDMSFSWSETPQGHAYWDRVAHKREDYLTAKLYLVRVLDALAYEEYANGA